MAALPYSVVKAGTGVLVAQFADALDADDYVTKVRTVPLVMIDTHRLADYRRRINVARFDRDVVVLND